ncbi:uncharacterized protein LOC129922978 [Biomphalaria glabrata]|uniref:Uncharacterized protein LOC129922978 n=1 Tax=Biomphalaria glabrata TaxID=6526 RepID=A0A9W2YXF5_BIOGL|nr:uncharacterized protein LOC129922978 [Biomphalaria glabrata]
MPHHYSLQILSLLFTILCSTTQADLETKISPSIFYVGLSQSLTVECFYSSENASTWTSLVSLSLHHSNSSSDPKYKEIVTFSSFDSQIHRYMSHKSDFQVSGALNNAAGSFLRIKWDFPKLNRTGAYKCEAIGLNRTGKPEASYSISLVSSAHPTLELVLDEFKLLAAQVDQQVSEKNEKDAILAELQQKVKYLFANVDYLQNELKSMRQADSHSFCLSRAILKLLRQILHMVNSFTLSALSALESFLKKP